MKSLSVGLRFVLAIAIFSFPIIILMFYMWRVNQDVLDFTNLELKGAEHLIAGAQLKESTYSTHFKIYSSTPPSAPEWDGLEKEWQNYLDSLTSVPFNKEEIQMHLKNYFKSSLEEKRDGLIFATTVKNLGQIRSAIADSHNIMLDPDSDSYYTMDLLTLWLPQIHEMQAELFYFSNTSSADLTSEIKTEKMRALYPLFAEAIRKTSANLEKIKQFDAVYYGESASFNSHYEKYKELVQAQSDLLSPYLKGSKNAFANDSQLKNDLNLAFAKNSELIQGLQQEFKYFVENRYQNLKNSMHKKIGLALGSLLFAVLIAAYLGKTISQTIKTFHGAVQNLNEESKQALSIGEVLIKASKKVSESSSEQAAAIEETSASLEELSSMVKNNAESSKQAQEVAQQARLQTQNCYSEMQTLISQMSEISTSSKKVEEIMLIIDDIAFQTNLLALNASVEAARAGEHGKGFAVVAEAVRSLAQKSASSAKEISVLIKTSLDQIANGRTSADRTGESMNTILSSIEKVSSLNTEIALASQEQSAGITQISQAISDLERTTMENSGVASQASEYSQKSLEQAEGLMRVVNVLESELLGQRRAQSRDTGDENLMNFDEAIQAHLKWKGRLKNFVNSVGNEELNSDHVCKDNNCALGKWIHGPGTSHQKLRSFQILKKEHAAFHEAAGEVVRSVEQRNETRAKKLLADGSEFDKKTRATIEAIQQLQVDVNKTV